MSLYIKAWLLSCRCARIGSILFINTSRRSVVAMNAISLKGWFVSAVGGAHKLSGYLRTKSRDLHVEVVFQSHPDLFQGGINPFLSFRRGHAAIGQWQLNVLKHGQIAD